MARYSNDELKAIAEEFRPAFESATIEEATVQALAADERKFTDNQIEKIYTYLVEVDGAEGSGEDSSGEGSEEQGSGEGSGGEGGFGDAPNPLSQEGLGDANGALVEAYVFNQPVMDRHDSTLVYQSGDDVPAKYHDDIASFLERGLIIAKA